MEMCLDRPPKSPDQRPMQQLSISQCPRWLWVSLRMALLMGLVSLPPLAIKELPATHRLRDSANVFMVLGCFTLGVWEPMLGNIVIIFTVLVPGTRMADTTAWIALHHSATLVLAYLKQRTVVLICWYVQQQQAHMA